MSTIPTTRAGPREILQRWRRQVASRTRYRASRGDRPWAAISYLARGADRDGLIDLRHLIVVVLYDQRQVTRFAGYRFLPSSGGVRLGGAAAHRFEKNLNLRPTPTGLGRRLKLNDRELLLSALELDHYLERRARFPNWPRSQQPRWPQLWVALTPEQVSGLQQEQPGRQLLGSCRSLGRLTLLPLATAIALKLPCLDLYADLKTVPRRQLVTVDHSARCLVGTDGALQYDLVESRFISS